MKIVVLDGYTLNPGDNSWEGLEKLGELKVYDRTADAEFFERAQGAEVLVTNKTLITKERLEKLSEVKFIAVLATGYNVVDTEAARARGISVSNVPTYGTDSVAQHALALLLELTNNVGSADRAVKEGRWAQCPDFCFWDKSSVELSGLTLGVVGFGRIGQQMGRLGVALGMKVVYADTAEVKVEGVPARKVTVEELFEVSDAVSLHCNQTAANTKFVNAGLLGRMKKTAYLVNTARGGLIDEAALTEALKAGRIAGAGLDVLSVEPPVAGHPLVELPNCIVTPHVSWSSLAGRKRLMQTAVGNVRGFIEGKLQNVVN